jgi:MtfA peptidase
MFFPWSKNRQRQKILSERFPDAWTGYLTRNVRHYSFVQPREKIKIQAVVSVLVAEKNWEGGSGFIVTDEMKVTVAAQAAVLTLGLDEPYYFDRVRSIILYPAAFVHPKKFPGHDPLMGVPIHGEAWHPSPIILSWQDVFQSGQNATKGNNLVFHEFAHHLDGLNGDMDGTPPLDREQLPDWYRVTEAEYLRLVGNARRQEVSLLDYYGASNRTEFFAVAVECFFEQPHAMRQQHPELYGVLQNFFRQDPAQWLPDANKFSPLPSGEGLGVRASGVSRPGVRDDQDFEEKKCGRNQTPQSAARTTEKSGDPFTQAVLHLNAGRYGQAEQAASDALQCDPEDDEAYSLRASARVHLRCFPAALDDANEAIRLNPGSDDAYRARAAALIGLHREESAQRDLDRVLDSSENDAEAYYLRGLVWSALGDLKRAVSDFSYSLALRPLSADALYHRGLALQKLGRAKDAEADLQKALQLDPEVAHRTY